MHILFLSDNFPPEVNAPASRTFEHCREWVRAGHQVTVVTCAPNFPQGKVFPGYRNRLWQEEHMDGIRVLRVWTYITTNEGTVRRTLDYLSFLPAATLASLFVRKLDVVVGTSPQFFTVCAAALLAACKRVPWVFELRDIWPESIRAVGAMKNERILGALERLECLLYRKARLIVTVTHTFREVLIRRGIDGGKIEVVTNGVDSSRFSPRHRDTALAAQLGLQGRFVAGYIGTHGMAHGLDTLLDAAKLLGDDYRILLLGDGATKATLRERAQRECISNVVFVDTVPKEDVARYWSLLDVSIIHLRKTELFTTVIPSKLFECMGMGIPVAHGVAGESAGIVEREEVGLVFEPENAGALAETLRRLHADTALRERLGRNGLLAATRYDRSELARRMVSLLQNLVTGARP